EPGQISSVWVLVRQLGFRMRFWLFWLWLRSGSFRRLFLWLHFFSRFGRFFGGLRIARRCLRGVLVRVLWRIVTRWWITGPSRRLWFLCWWLIFGRFRGIRIRTLRRIWRGLRTRLRVRTVRARAWCLCSFACGHDTRPTKNSRFRCGSYRRIPAVHRNMEFAVASGSLLLLGLHWCGFTMGPPCDSPIFRGRSRRRSPGPPLVTSAGGRGVVCRDRRVCP